MFQLTRDADVFTLTMDAGENRWNTAFVRGLAAVLDEVEASTGAAALVTTASSPKFYSNGLDLAWRRDPAAHPEAGDPAVFADEFMKLMARVITFPVPTLAAVNGHAFGAGLMFALCHDIRHMRADRGYLCANEMQLGLAIPTPELALFRHKLSQDVFFETVQLARRWTADEALARGIVQATAPVDALLPERRRVPRSWRRWAPGESSIAARRSVCTAKTPCSTARTARPTCCATCPCTDTERRARRAKPTCAGWRA